MISSGRTKYKKILKMLKQCAKGFEISDKKHLRWVYYNGLSATLPLGDHSSRGPRTGQAEIENGHVRNMVRALQIDAHCAKKVLGIQLSLQ